jgi:hypothetical protein
MAVVLRAVVRFAAKSVESSGIEDHYFLTSFKILSNSRAQHYPYSGENLVQDSFHNGIYDPV